MTHLPMNSSILGAILSCQASYALVRAFVTPLRILLTGMQTACPTYGTGWHRQAMKATQLTRSRIIPSMVSMNQTITRIEWKLIADM